IPLPVAGAYHSPLMQPAQGGLAEALDKVELREPLVPVYSNVTGQAHAAAGTIADTMVDQVTSPVKWEACIRAMIADGITRFIELGPGKALSGFMRRIDRDIEMLNIADCDSLAKAAESLNG
ncbi:MAG TPA: [acyl-carrier-protein] S-malonyltransferase, partial [Verrucomicrobiota bacterium]|nr:[acyl-carrier-protein] S-malonyltransferase [Verrucomicrobiota bacterium]